MKLRTIALVLTVVFAFAVAHAQTGVYVTADTQQFNQMGVNAIRLRADKTGPSVAHWDRVRRLL